MRKIATTIFILFISISSVLVLSAQINEKSKLLDSYFGDFRKAKKIKKTGKVTLRVWEPYIQYVRTLPSLYQTLLEGVQKLNVEYDEIWISKEIDICKLYWNKNRVQAATVAKEYLGNPYTGQKLPKPSYKIIGIYNRYQILQKLGSNK